MSFSSRFFKEKQIKNVVRMQNDDDRQRVEEPFALIPDVGNRGRQCGSANIILELKNLCKSRIKTHTHTHTFYYRLRRSNMTYETKKYYISRDTCESE